MLRLIERKETAEDILADPACSELHQAAQFFMGNRKTILFPDRFMVALKLVINERIDELYKKNPEMPLLKVVNSLMQSMNENMTAEMILETTTYILKMWQLEQQHDIKELELELA